MDKTPYPDPEPGCSFAFKSPIRAVCRNLKSSFENASSRDILPIHSVQRTVKRKQYRRGANITTTP